MRASLEKELTESVLMLLHRVSPKSFTLLLNEIKLERGRLSPKSLSYILKELEKKGMIERRELRQIPPRVDYYITQKGKDKIVEKSIQQIASISGLLPEQRTAREILMKACRKMLWADALKSEDDIDKYLSRFNLKLRDFEEIETVPIYEDLRLAGKMQRTSFKPIRGISLYKIREEYVPGRVSIHYGVMWPGIEINDFEGDEVLIGKVFQQLTDFGILKETPETLYGEKRYDLADATLKNALYELRNLSDYKWAILLEEVSSTREPTDSEIAFIIRIFESETEAFHIIKDADEDRKEVQKDVATLNIIKQLIPKHKRKYAERVRKAKEKYGDIFKKYNHMLPVFKTINEDIFA